LVFVLKGDMWKWLILAYASDKEKKFSAEKGLF
jgi:hypothetical protein